MHCDHQFSNVMLVVFCWDISYFHFESFVLLCQVLHPGMPCAPHCELVNLLMCPCSTLFLSDFLAYFGIFILWTFSILGGILAPVPFWREGPSCVINFTDCINSASPYLNLGPPPSMLAHTVNVTWYTQGSIFLKTLSNQFLSYFGFKKSFKNRTTQ